MFRKALVSKTCLLVLLGTVLLFAGCAGPDLRKDPEATDAYARCNLKVLRSDIITWYNWQASPGLLPVGTRLRVGRVAKNPHYVPRADQADEEFRGQLLDLDTGKLYTFYPGSDDPKVFQKFLSRTPPDLSGESSWVLEQIKDQVARLGMTKESVYVAMGPPAIVRRNDSPNKVETAGLTYEEILSADTWIYLRRNFGKDIGVAFGREGKVVRTEGIWR